MIDALRVRDDWESRLLRTVRWSPSLLMPAPSWCTAFRTRDGMWEPLRAELAPPRRRGPRRCPGFGDARPGRLRRPPKEAYAGWLEDQIAGVRRARRSRRARLGGAARPTRRVATPRPDPRRSRAGSGPCDETYTWHAMAQAWQTPEVGEQIVDGMLGAPDGRPRRGPRGRAVHPPISLTEQAEHIDAEMAR